MKRTKPRRLSRRMERQISAAAIAQKDRVRETASRLREAQRRSNRAADLQREEMWKEEQCLGREI